jgi:hypothetical protein
MGLAQPSIVPLAEIDDIQLGRRRLRDVDARLHCAGGVNRAVEGEDDSAYGASRAVSGIPHRKDGSCCACQHLLGSATDQKGMELAQATVADRNQVRAKRAGTVCNDPRH